MADHPYSFGPLALGLVPAKQVDELQNYGDRLAALTASTKLAYLTSFVDVIVKTCKSRKF